MNRTGLTESTQVYSSLSVNQASLGLQGLLRPNVFLDIDLPRVIFERSLFIKVPFQVSFSVAELVIHMQGLHQTAALSQNKELDSMTTTSQNPQWYWSMPIRGIFKVLAH